VTADVEIIAVFHTAQGIALIDIRRSKKPDELRADLAAGELLCGRMRFTPHEMAGALKKPGFKLVRIAAKEKALEEV
jgi:hypothetical protein